MNTAVSRIAQSVSQKHLELIILPTEKCNFRCTYCYEDFAIGKMKPEIVLGIKKLIKNRVENGLTSLKLSWFGGEPLLAKDVVCDISDYALRLAQDNPHLQYEGSITTNGYTLNLDTLTKLVHLGIRDYQISLDGTKAAHDQTRLVANGQGSFDKIWQNLIAAKASDLNFKITLRLHVTPGNLNTIPELIHEINQTFSGDTRFHVFMKAIENLGGPHANTFETIHHKNRSQILNDLYHHVDPSITIEKVESRKPYICYAAQANSFLIRANGKLGKCTVALNDDSNDIGHITPEGELVINNQKLAPWVRGLSSLDLGSLACPMMAKG